MSARFAEDCRPSPLLLTDVEGQVEDRSVKDGRITKDICLKCEQDIVIGVFFDGTNNNKYRDTASLSHSNVARLYEAFPGTPTKQTLPKLKKQVLPDGSSVERDIRRDKVFKGNVPPEAFSFHRKIYVPGIGTPHPDVGDDGDGFKKMLGLAVALVGRARLDWASLQLCNQVYAAVFGSALQDTFDISRIANHGVNRSAFIPDSVEAILDGLRQRIQDETGQYDSAAFEHLLAEAQHKLAQALKQRGRNATPKLRKIRLSVFGFSRGAAAARAWVNLVVDRWGRSGLGGVPLQIDFLGIFDTVASVGLAQSAAIQGADGHSGWAEGESMVISPEVKRCVHLVAGLELRGSFPLDSVCRDGVMALNCKEIVYPGVHSDVGGGYPPDDQGRALGAGPEGDSRKLSQISLAQMYREARMAGVPLAPAEAMDKDVKAYFNIHPELREHFNSYIAATRSGHRAPTHGSGRAAVASMFPTETQPPETLAVLMRRHAGYLLQWRRQMLQTPGRIAALPGLLAMTANSKWQDSEDFRGAEEELAKELRFLNSKDPGKYTQIDDPSIGLLFGSGSLTKKAMTDALVRMIPMRVGVWGRETLKQAVLACMQEKQLQWDTWLRAAWHGSEGTALAAAQAVFANQLFERYVHDSRAWFKPLLATDTRKRTPDDEEWFTLGGREAERRQRKAKLNEARAEAAKDGKKNAVAAIDAQLKELDQPGRPLIIGGREPYQMWGYVRHRRIYMSGKFTPQKARAFESAREETDRDVTRRELLTEEKNYHEKRKADIRKRRDAVWANEKLPEKDRRLYWEGADSQLSNEINRNRSAVEDINRKFGARTPADT